MTAYSILLSVMTGVLSARISVPVALAKLGFRGELFGFYSAVIYLSYGEGAANKKG